MHNYNNAVFNHMSIFDNVKFGVAFSNDDEIRKQILEYYLLYDMAYPDDKTMEILLQKTANNIRGYYNKLYSTTILEYDPLTTYNINQIRTEEENLNSNVYQYPANNATKRQTDSGDGERGLIEEIERTGNTGLYTKQKLIKDERALIINIIYEYIKEFRYCFMITT